MVNHGWQCFYQPWLTMFCQPWLTMVDNAFANHGQPWLTEVPFHKPMVDYGLEKLCQTMVNHGWLWFKKSFAKPWLTLSVFFCLFSVKPLWPNHGQPTRLVQVPALLVENRYKVSLLTWDGFVQTGVLWSHKGKFQSLHLHQNEYLCKAHIFV